jgi:hypothetical protein
MANSIERDCDRYWLHAEWLPLEEIVKYWCEHFGLQEESCRDAKTAAIVAACEKGDISWRRGDGKDFIDPLNWLAARGALDINRESFDRWVCENFHNESPLPEKPLNEKERSKMLAVILGMAMDKYGYDPQKDRNEATGENNGSIKAALDKYGLTVDVDTIRKYLKEAAKINHTVKPRKS